MGGQKLQIGFGGRKIAPAEKPRQLWPCDRIILADRGPCLTFLRHEIGRVRSHLDPRQG